MLLKEDVFRQVEGVVGACEFAFSKIENRNNVKSKICFITQ